MQGGRCRCKPGFKGKRCNISTKIDNTLHASSKPNEDKTGNLLLIDIYNKMFENNIIPTFIEYYKIFNIETNQPNQIKTNKVPPPWSLYQPRCKRRCLNGGVCLKNGKNRCSCTPGFRGRFCHKGTLSNLTKLY